MICNNRQTPYYNGNTAGAMNNADATAYTPYTPYGAYTPGGGNAAGRVSDNYVVSGVEDNGAGVAGAAGGMAAPNPMQQAVDPLAGTNVVPAPLPEQGDPMPETLTEYIYTPGYLRTNIGKLMRVEFLIGNNTNDRVGILREVGASYIVLGSLEADSKIMCDIYSIKFVTIIESELSQALLGAF